MPIFGSHLSVAGGLWRAADQAIKFGLDALQIFTKNNNRWSQKPLPQDEIERFRSHTASAGLRCVVSHNSYLINLASPEEAMWQRSIDAMVDELERAAALGIPFVVAHPGAHMGAGEREGIQRIAAGLDAVLSRTGSLSPGIALETTAGQGSCIGHRFEHLAEIISGCRQSNRLFVCLDTCHVFAAGYPLSPERNYLRTMSEFCDILGLDRLKVIHVNDSKRELGSRVDRHEHIGHGKIGIDAFGKLVNDRRFQGIPMILETAKEKDEASGRHWDEINLECLRGLIRLPAKARRKSR